MEEEETSSSSKWGCEKLQKGTLYTIAGRRNRQLSLSSLKPFFFWHPPHCFSILSRILHSSCISRSIPFSYRAFIYTILEPEVWKGASLECSDEPGRSDVPFNHRWYSVTNKSLPFHLKVNRPGYVSIQVSKKKKGLNGSGRRTSVLLRFGCSWVGTNM